jgi:hypothetical protein
MTDDRKTRTDDPRREDDGRKIAGTDAKGDIANRDRRKAAAALLSPAIPPAAAGAMSDADPRLDDRTETEEALERATATPD